MSVRTRLGWWRWRTFGQTKRELRDECDELLRSRDRLRAENDMMRKRLAMAWYVAQPEYSLRLEVLVDDERESS